MEVTLITLNVITLDNLMQMRPYEASKEKNIPEYIFPLKYVQYQKHSPVKKEARTPLLVELETSLQAQPGHLSGLFSVKQRDPRWYSQLRTRFLYFCLSV